MSADNQIEENHKARSSFVRGLVQRPIIPTAASLILSETIPKRIVQFWDNMDQLPMDVRECMETWKATEKHGFERVLFDKHQAGNFIQGKLGLRYKQAYDNCYHPAMQSDYFRLCYILVEGGCYVDTDDVYSGFSLQHLFNDSRLKIQPLCYDTASHMMVPPSIFAQLGADTASWIFYFNNNPLIASSGHPLIEYALAQATLSLEKGILDDLPEIQSTTGPGNLTKSIFKTVNANRETEKTLLVLCDWENVARSKWELSYRNDSRNWRLSNCQTYQK